ncbi:iron-containing alcohol dehydrogenase [Acidobacteriota bacterium]
MNTLNPKARRLLDAFKGNNYVYGTNCLEKIGELSRPFGKKVLLITSLHSRDIHSFQNISNSLINSELEIIGHSLSARPNSPREDVHRMKEAILVTRPDSLVVASGGSGIDAAKAAIVLADLGGDLDEYFGVGKVTEKLKQSNKKLLPCVAVQTASGSAAHLTKYSNITDLRIYQKKLIIDEAIVPPRCLFDYSLTKSMSPSFTCDGAFDGLAHCLEVYYSANEESIAKIEEISLTGIGLIVAFLEKAVNNPSDIEAREAIGLATDLGGYAIMTGGTNGAHLASFSLVDILSHGRACAILNPYYTVFFAPSIQRQLKHLTDLFIQYGLMPKESASFRGRELGTAVANGLIALSRRVNFPTTLGEIKGITTAHTKKALQAAKNPQLESKLKNMPVPLTAEMVNEYMGPILEAALSGDFSRIKMLQQP